MEENNQKILCFAGKAMSGKTTAGNCLASAIIQSTGLCKQSWVDKFGRLCVSDILGDNRHEGILDLQSKNPNVIEFLNEYVHPFVKLYSFADLLKGIVIEAFGMSFDDVYGEEGKKRESKFRWEDLPIKNDKKGNLTNREFLQIFGTDICRKIYPNIWADSTLRRIKEEGSALAILTDGRFTNEFVAVQNEGGTVIRLTRNSNSTDSHPSEKEMDDYTKYDFVIKNDDMNIVQQAKAVYSCISDWQVLPEIS